MRRAVLLLFLLALGVRVAAAVVFGIGGPPVEDERGYVMLASSLAEDGSLELYVPQLAGANADTVPPRTSFRAPGLPLLLAPLRAAGAGPMGMRILVLVLASLGAPLLFLASRPLLGARPALWAAVVYALWPPAVYLSLRVLSEMPSMALLLGGLALLVARPAPQAGAWRAAASGALVAASVLVRPSALLAALPLGFAAGGRRRVIAFFAAAVVVLAPWVVRNTILHGRPLGTTNTGVTLVGGNSEAARRAVPPGKWVPPSLVYGGRADAPDLGMWGWSVLGEEGSDRRFATDAWEWVSADPGRAAALAYWKVRRLFDPDPRSAKDDAALKRWLGYATLLPVLVLAMIGLMRRRRRPGWLPWYLLIAGTVVTAVVFYGDSRMRTAADPALLVLAAAGAASLRPGRNELVDEGSE